jgi:DNA-binding transcriptional LysR family regulator
VANVPTEVRDWEAARVFLEVSRSGSFRAAAQKLGQSVNALRRMIEKFERELGAPLLTRYVGGVQLTEEGNRIAEAALRMEEAAIGLAQARDSFGAQTKGEVRLSVTEGLGTHWLLPRLVQFQKANPGLVINIKLGQKPADMLRLEADISVQLQRPAEPDLKVLKLGRLHLILWASQGYLAEHGRPRNLAELAKHRLIVQSSEDQIQWETAYRKALGEASANAITLRTNSSITNFWALAGGAGIGFLPSYFRALCDDLVPLDAVEPSSMDIWLVYPPGAADIARVRNVMDCIVESFDPRTMPWFRDEFVPPDRFAQTYKGRQLPGRVSITPAGMF